MCRFSRRRGKLCPGAGKAVSRRRGKVTFIQQSVDFAGLGEAVSRCRESCFSAPRKALSRCRGELTFMRKTLGLPGAGGSCVPAPGKLFPGAVESCVPAPGKLFPGVGKRLAGRRLV